MKVYLINAQKNKIPTNIFSKKQLKLINSYIDPKEKQLKCASEMFKSEFATHHKLNVDDIIRTGKPRFKDCKYDFSISHSYPYCIFAESKDKVGIDIQQTIKFVEIKHFIKRFFLANEAKYCGNSLDKFYEVLCNKEAAFKYLNNEKKSMESIDTLSKNNKFYFTNMIYKGYFISLCTNKKEKIKLRVL
jgi:phosphopantetheinyl transferase